MGYLVWQLIYFLLSFLGNSIMAFMTLQPFHHIGQSARVIPLYLLLLLLEWLEGLQPHLNKATHLVHRPPPSTSRLLSLPPEIRLRIWTILLEDIEEFEEMEYVQISNLGPRLYRYSDRLRLYMDMSPQYLTKWVLLDWIYRPCLQWPPVFMHSCRQIYHEAGYNILHGLCISETFHFSESRALISWTQTLTPVQRRLVGEINMIMSNDNFNDPGIAPAMHQLTGLRRLQLIFYTDDKGASNHTSDVQAHIVWQFVRSVRVSEVLMILLVENEDFEYVTVRWPAHAQAAYARAVEARIRRPSSAVRYRVPVGRRGEARFVLKVKRLY